MKSTNPKSRRSVGFTLIELLVVLVILAAVAGLVIPKLGYVQEQAGNATAAAASAQLVSNLETYKTSTGSYPQGLDTLVTNDATPALYSKIWGHPDTGSGAFGLKNYLTTGALLSTESFGHSFSPSPTTGQYTFYDHATGELTTDAATTRTGFSPAGTYAIVDTAYSTVTYPSNPLILAAGYPSGTLPSGVQLVAFGVGPNTAAVGATMASAPTHIEEDQSKYSRFVALFAVYQSGKSAQLKAVVDSQGVPIGQNITDYRNGAPERN